MAIEFYKEFGELGYLANYSNHGFYKKGIYYKTVEHYYQSEKFDDPIIKEKIINAETPKEASNIGRDRNNIRKENFKDIKNQVMLDGVLAKFRQNKDILYKLIETRNEEIIEKTVDEYYWGAGKDYSGQNVFGKILMNARRILRQDVIDSIINNCGKEVYILGHNNPDFDSIVSSYLLANVLNSINIKAHFAVLDHDYEYCESDAELINDFVKVKPEVINSTDDKKIILVDHNTLDGINKENVVGAFDHHIITNQVDNVLEMEYASCALLIYDMFKLFYQFSPKEKYLVALSVLADTEYLCSSRCSEEDKKIFNSLHVDIDVEGLQLKYFKTTDFNNDIESNINKCLKHYNFDDISINRVLISSYSNDYKKYYNDYVEYINSKEGNWLLIWADYENKKTYINYNNENIVLNYLTTSTYVVLKNIDSNKTYIKR